MHSTFSPTPGDTIAGKYRIVARTDDAARMAFEADTLADNARVALHWIPMAAPDAARIERFKRDVEITGRMGHAGLLTLHEVGQHLGHLYVVTEPLQGMSLEAKMRGGVLSCAHALQLLLPALSALRAAHAQAVVHGALTPESIWLAPGSGPAQAVRVLDFGLAHLNAHARGPHTYTHTLHLTDYQCLSPEQLRGSTALNPRMDVYSIAAVLYRMLTGHVPVEANNAIDLALRIGQTSPVPVLDHAPDLPPAVAAWVDRALARDPADRPASIEELARGLAPFASGLEHQLSAEYAYDADKTVRRVLRREDLLRALGREPQSSRAAPAPRVSVAARAVETDPVGTSGPLHAPAAQPMGKLSFLLLAAVALGTVTYLAVRYARQNLQPEPRNEQVQPAAQASEQRATPGSRRPPQTEAVAPAQPQPAARPAPVPNTDWE